MATGQLSIKITVDGTDYYVSDDEFISPSGTLHYPFVIQAPVITLGANQGGWLQYKSGSFAMESRPIDDTHPFGGPRYTGDLLNIGSTYPIVINFGLLGYDWLTGIAVLESISQDQLQFSVYPDEYTTSPVSSVTDVDGNSVANPWGYGAFTHATPLIRKTSGSPDVWHNSTGLTSGLTLYEDGTALTLTASSTELSASDYSVDEGEVSLSSSNTKTLEDFFDYVATSLSLDATAANTAKATSASSYGVKLYWTKEEPLIEIASKIAEAYNHQFYIAVDPNSGSGTDTTLFLIDRANNPSSFTTLEEDLILSASCTLGFPLGGVSGTFTVTTPEAGKLVQKQVEFRAENQANGRELTAPVYADSYGDSALVLGRLQAIRDIEKKPLVSVTVPDIQVDYKPGDRFKFSREQDFLTADMIARSITYDFRNQTTKLEGDATLSAYIRRF